MYAPVGSGPWATVHKIESVGLGVRPDHGGSPIPVYEEPPCRSLASDTIRPPVHTPI